MIHITCDLCGSSIEEAKNHYRVEIEVFAMDQNDSLTEDDLDQDNLEHIAMLINDSDTTPQIPASNSIKYDLCPKCTEKFQRNPLSRETDASVNFSDN